MAQQLPHRCSRGECQPSRTAPPAHGVPALPQLTQAASRKDTQVTFPSPQHLPTCPKASSLDSRSTLGTWQHPRTRHALLCLSQARTLTC